MPCFRILAQVFCKQSSTIRRHQEPTLDILRTADWRRLTNNLLRSLHARTRSRRQQNEVSNRNLSSWNAITFNEVFESYIVSCEMRNLNVFVLPRSTNAPIKMFVVEILEFGGSSRKRWYVSNLQNSQKTQQVLGKRKVQNANDKSVMKYRFK